MVSAVEEPASDGESREADDEDYEHDDPAPVGRHPRSGIMLACERPELAEYIRSYQGPGVGLVELLEYC